MLLDSYRTMIEFYRDMVDYLKTLKSAESACNAVVKAMQKFSYGKVNFANDIGEFQDMLAATDTLETIVDGFEGAIMKAEEALGKAECIEERVIYMRDVEEMRLYEIADLLGYTYDYIRKVSSRNPKTVHN